MFCTPVLCEPDVDFHAKQLLMQYVVVEETREAALKRATYRVCVTVSYVLYDQGHFINSRH